MSEYLLLFAVVFGINLMPAFGPPTWSIIVLFGLNTDLPVPAIVGIGAVAAASGRFGLAHGTRLLRRYVSDRTKANLEAARAALETNKRRGALALGLFALSPVPSAQLFEAAGLTSPLGIALQVVMLAGLVALAKIDWAKRLARK